MHALGYGRREEEKISHDRPTLHLTRSFHHGKRMKYMPVVLLGLYNCMEREHLATGRKGNATSMLLWDRVRHVSAM